MRNSILPEGPAFAKIEHKMTSERSPKSEIEVLRDKVAWLEETIRRLSEERDKAIKAKETLIQQVLPMASAQRRKPTISGRGISMVMLVVLLAAIIFLAMYMPRMARKVSSTMKLPPGVELRQEEVPADEKEAQGEEAEGEEAFE